MTDPRPARCPYCDTACGSVPPGWSYEITHRPDGSHGLLTFAPPHG